MSSILQTMSCSTGSDDLSSRDEFISSLSTSRYRVSSSNLLAADHSCLELSPASVDTQGHCHGDESAAGASKSLVVDAGKFLAERNLIGQFKVSELMDFFSCYNICFVAGRNGFSSNIRTIEGDILNIMMLKIIPHTHTHTHSYTHFLLATAIQENKQQSPYTNHILYYSGYEKHKNSNTSTSDCLYKKM